jgi:hypothetical protein
MSSIGILIYIVGFIAAAVVALVAYKNHWKIADYF